MSDLGNYDLGNYYAKMWRARPSIPAPFEVAKVRKKQANPTARVQTAGASAV
jgi:hypothetical protein